MNGKIRFFLLLKVFRCKYIAITCLFLGFCIPAIARQSIPVRGTVTDGNGESLPGVSIAVSGTRQGTVTDLNGNYTIEVSDPETVLQFSYLGYATQSIKVGSRHEINVSMQEDLTMLDEVVVVGYGVQRKSDVTGAITRVGAKEIEARPVVNAMQALQGKAAGVDITSNERPGELGTVLIRGNRSISASNDPLYVVDGVPLMSASAIETINPRDIESVDILKDASATAIYGSRGANGVILVTTKKGKEGNYKLNYSGTVTSETQKTKSKMLNSRWCMRTMFHGFSFSS